MTPLRQCGDLSAAIGEALIGGAVEEPIGRLAAGDNC
jgi:hypothetical protein